MTSLADIAEQDSTASSSYSSWTRFRDASTSRFPVLVAVSPDECTHAVVQVAEAIATQRGGAPSLLYVTELAPLTTLDGGIATGVLVQTLLDPQRRKYDEQSLRTTCHTNTGMPATWPFDIEIGDVATSIVIHARRMNAQLVVMGMRHHSLLERAFKTDTLRDVMSLGGMPILAVRPELTTLPRSIVVATDFSRASLRAARLARRLLASDGTMHLVYVAPPRGHLRAERDDGERLVATNGIEMTFVQVRQMLDPEPSMHIVPVRRTGDPIAELTAACETIRPDLVAIGSQRHPFLERLFLGSVAKAIASDGRWSTLVTPPRVSSL